MKIFAIFLSIVGLFLSITTSYASDAASRFQSFVKLNADKTDNAKKTYLNKNILKWAVRKFSLSELKLDVKKTDSLINPIVGYVSFKLVSTQSDFFESEQEALKSETITDKLTSHYDIQLKYVLQDTKWVLDDGQYVSNRLPKERFRINRAGIEKEPAALPFVALQSWLTE